MCAERKRARGARRVSRSTSCADLVDQQIRLLQSLGMDATAAVSPTDSPARAAPRPPPPTPTTPFYCEENTVLLLRALQSRIPPPTRSYALFVTNQTHTAILFQQKASQRGPEQEHYVVWDYHVIPVTVEEDGSSWVWDQDSILGSRVPWKGAPRRELDFRAIGRSLHVRLQTTSKPLSGLTSLTMASCLPSWRGERARGTAQAAPRADIPSYSRFRVVPSQVLFDNFASDRSHMVRNVCPCSSCG